MNLSFLIECASILAIWYSCYVIFLQKSGSHLTKRIYLMGGLLLSIVIPSITIPFFPELVYIPVNFSRPNVPFNNVVVPVKADYTMLVVQLFYWGGVLFFGLRFLFRCIKMNHLIRKANIHIHRDVKLHIIEGAHKMASFGPYIVASEDELEKGLNLKIAHEKAHISQLHSFDILFSSLYQVFFWFNPFSWLMEKRIKEVHEYLADQTTLREYPNYTIQLLKTSIEKYKPIPIANSYYSFIQKRIEMLTNPQKRKSWKYLLIFPFIAFFLYSFSFTTYPVLVDQNGNYIMSDTIIDPNLDKDTIIYDTSAIYDPDTFEEEIKITGESMTKREYIRRFGTPSPAEKQKMISYTDTIVVFDAETYEEEIKVTTYTISENEYMQKFGSRKTHSHEGFIEVIDTVAVYNPETYEETIHINRTMMTREEASDPKKRLAKMYPEASDKSTYQSDLIEVIDTTTVFDPETYEETIEITRSLMNKADYDAQKKHEAKIKQEGKSGNGARGIYNVDDKSLTFTVPGKDGKTRDTIFRDTNPEFFKEVPRNSGVDTIAIYDPATFSETIIVKNYTTGQVDTISKKKNEVKPFEQIMTPAELEKVRKKNKSKKKSRKNN